VAVFVPLLVNPLLIERFLLIGFRVGAGEWWRIVSVLFVPFSLSPIWVFFSWYIFYLYGTSLEREWGTTRYMLYIIIAYAATLVGSYIFPLHAFSNVTIYSSVFLAFAYLYPNFQLLLFFIIPVKIKWLAYFAWAVMGWTLLTGDISAKGAVFVTITNFIVFFGKQIAFSVQGTARLARMETKQRIETAHAHHECRVCHMTERKNPDMDIRYCNECIPEECYCGRHIDNHKHVVVN
jgi:membrane associated rhomboid family serine protease